LKFTIMLVILGIMISVLLLITPGSGFSAVTEYDHSLREQQDSLKGVFEATGEQLSFFMDLDHKNVSINHQFLIISDWQAVTVLQIPVIYDSTGITEELKVSWSLEDSLQGEIILTRDEGFKLSHGFKGYEIITITLDSAREMSNIFDQHGFIYNLKTEFVFQSFSGFVDWTMNFTVLQPVIYSFNPVNVASIESNSSLSVESFPSTLIMTGSSMNGFHCEFLFFIDCGILPEDTIITLELFPVVESSGPVISRIVVKDLTTDRTLLDKTGSDEGYSLQLDSFSGDIAGIIPYSVEVEFSGSVTETTLTVAFLITLTSGTTTVQPFNFEEILFDPLPSSLHLPLLLFSLSPLGIFVYKVKKEQFGQKAVLEE